MKIEYENLKPHSFVQYENKTYKIDHIVVNSKSIMVHLEGMTSPVDAELLQAEKIQLDTTEIVEKYRSKNKN